MVTVEQVDIPTEVILFSKDLEHVILLHRGTVVKEFYGHRVKLLHDTGRAVNVPIRYNEGTYIPYVVGRDKKVIAIHRKQGSNEILLQLN